MPPRIVLELTPNIMSALQADARCDLRAPRDQALFLLRNALQERGLLADDLHHIPTACQETAEAVNATSTR